MSETRLTVTTSFASMIAGAVNVNLQNQSSSLMRYCTDTGAPAAAVRGIILKPGEMHPVNVAAGSNLYVVAPDAHDSPVAVAINVP